MKDLIIGALTVLMGLTLCLGALDALNTFFFVIGFALMCIGLWLVMLASDQVQDQDPVQEQV